MGPNAVNIEKKKRIKKTLSLTPYALLLPNTMPFSAKSRSQPSDNHTIQMNSSSINIFQEGLEKKYSSMEQLVCSLETKLG